MHKSGGAQIVHGTARARRACRVCPATHSFTRPRCRRCCCRSCSRLRPRRVVASRIADARHEPHALEPRRCPPRPRAELAACRSAPLAARPREPHAAPSRRCAFRLAAMAAARPSTPNRRSSPRRPPTTPKPACPRPPEAPHPDPVDPARPSSPERRPHRRRAAAHAAPPPPAVPDPNRAHPRVVLASLMLLHPSIAAGKPPHRRNRRFPKCPCSVSRPGTSG